MTGEKFKDIILYIESLGLTCREWGEVKTQIDRQFEVQFSRAAKSLVLEVDKAMLEKGAQWVCRNYSQSTKERHEKIEAAYHTGNHLDPPANSSTTKRTEVHVIEYEVKECACVCGRKEHMADAKYCADCGVTLPANTSE
jgi:hypothetical protein